MLAIALKMLVGDRARYVGILVGLTFASLLITQQAGIFTGLMTRTYGFITDTGEPELWVMDPEVNFVDDVKPMRGVELFRVRGVTGVDWAVPMYRGLLRATLPGGNTQMVTLVGLDDATLIGGPPKMLKGEVADLRSRDAIIIDMREGRDKLLKPSDEGLVPLEVGDVIEINDRRAVVVGLADASPTFGSQPMVYTTYNRALEIAPAERKLLSYVLVGTKEGENVHEVARRIEAATGLKALTREQFKEVSYDYYFEHTGIPVNFGLAVALGFAVGIAIAGQMFYNFTIDNLRYFGTLKAMGASASLLTKMILVQALFVGFIGYGLGVGSAALFGILLAGSRLAFKISWPLLLFTAVAVLFICALAAIISIRRVIKLEPAVVFRL